MRQPTLQPWIPPVLLLLLCGAAAAWPPQPEQPAMLLHPRLPEVLDRAWIERLGLYADVAGLRSVRFSRGDRGGLLARLEVADPQAPQGLRVLVRNVARERWDILQERAAAILAGEDPPPLPADPLSAPPWAEGRPDPAADGHRDHRDPLAGVRSWPETAPPPAALPRELLRAAGPVPWRGSWLAVIEIGARLNVTGFNTFFSPMGQIGIAFGRGLNSRLVPLLGFYAGFGDMRPEFEDVYGDGRSNVFGFTLAMLARQEVSERSAFYLEGGGGYHIRSLYWGGLFYDPRSGQYLRGYVLEQQDWGWQVRLGWLRARAHRERPRLLDIGLALQSSLAERWSFRRDGRVFVGDDRDLWVVLSIRFWDGL